MDRMSRKIFFGRKVLQTQQRPESKESSSANILLSANWSTRYRSGLPDGIFFPKQNTNSGILLRASEWICWYFCGFLEYSAAISYILWPFGTFCGLFFSCFGVFAVLRKIWQPWYRWRQRLPMVSRFLVTTVQRCFWRKNAGVFVFY
jgi:hypothetical protein